MYNNIKNNVFDAMLKTAFNEYADKQLEMMPSDEELNEAYPIPKKEFSTAKKLQKRVKYGKSPALVYLQRACVIALICIVAVCALIATSPIVRAAIGNTVVSWFEDHIVVDFTKDPVPPMTKDTGGTDSENEIETEPATVDSLKIGYIPEGFELSSSEEKASNRQYIYTSESGAYFILHISLPEYSSISIDSDDVSFTEMIINGNESYMVYDDVNAYGTIVSGNDNYVISISGMLEKEELKHLVEEIK